MLTEKVSSNLLSWHSQLYFIVLQTWLMSPALRGVLSLGHHPESLKLTSLDFFLLSLLCDAWEMQGLSRSYSLG